ncbi:MAG: hypothetical protein RML93_13690 [Anaerolineales bacterium]|nr:hypothetical protein [Anaerolineales bacterium]MCS7248595.1 hypothetical protein [Anaerolineales bacterium]MDW8162408.1 hypothetical protein [Anaerolineales bacterium]MDW8448326.1 hypothetical protein [Anaerolineales bacterium]
MSLWQHLFFSLLLSLPFIGFSLIASQAGFLSNQHAHLVAKVLQAIEYRRLELIGFTYPPLPFLLTALWARPLMPSLIASLAAGATAWLLLRHLLRTSLSPLTVVLVLCALAFTPATLYIATQSLTEMATLLLFLLAWLAFLRFTRYGETLSGFVSGLILGFAFFFNAYALFFSVAYALGSPLFYAWRRLSPRERKWQADLTLVIVIGFPSLLAFLSWAYLNWVFTGDAWLFLTDPTAPLYTFFSPTETTSLDLFSTLAYSLQEVTRAPLYLAGAVLVAVHMPKRLVAYFVSFGVIAVVRMLGWNYTEAMAIATYSVVAGAGIPVRTSRAWDKPLLLVAILHFLLNLNSPYQSNELRVWEQVILKQQVQTQDALETEIAQWLCKQPPQSILADDRAVYRLVARCGDSRPFLLPAEGEFLMALHAPAQFVNYVLVQRQGAPALDQVSQRYATAPPPGFRVGANWDSWTLYRRIDAEAQLSGSGTLR